MEMQYQFFNRELSWIEFNARVLCEACRPSLPLFERLRFLGIVSSNFDEFFMVRVAALKRQALSAQNDQALFLLEIEQQLDAISHRVHQLLQKQYDSFASEIVPQLQNAGLAYIKPQNYTSKQTQFLKHYFLDEVFPLLTPLRFEQGSDLPHITNLRPHVAFLLKAMLAPEELQKTFGSVKTENLLALVQIPASLNPIIWLPAGENGGQSFTLIDDVIQTFGTYLFPGFTVEESLIFKITRDADFAVDENRTEDFVQAMEEVLEQRQNSFLVRLQCTNTSPAILNILTQSLQLTRRDVYQVAGPVDLPSFAQVASIEGFDHLKYPVWKHFKNHSFEKDDVWQYIKTGDRLLHLPYENFDAVLNLLNRAAEDKDVLAVKMTLYRTSGDSPIVQALEKAAQNGKHVTAFIELKARFDEERNISWARRLERAGVIVVYGIKNLKVHAKMLLIVRHESEGIRRYVHISTGNYNDKTARLYGDFALFTARPEIANDATVFFNMISGYSAIQTMKQLAMAPFNLKQRLIEMIEREADHARRGGAGLIMAKMNSLAHEEIIKALYKASCAGVKILLNVRGICMLVPGVENLSENIRVTSIIDRYLEHARVFYFYNGGDEETYLSSADWMPRNLDKRVELMVPVVQEDLQNQLKESLNIYFADNCQSHDLLPNGEWMENQPDFGKNGHGKKSEKIRSQEEFYKKYQNAASTQEAMPTLEFIVRRK